MFDNLVGGTAWLIGWALRLFVLVVCVGIGFFAGMLVGAGAAVLLSTGDGSLLTNVLMWGAAALGMFIGFVIFKVSIYDAHLDYEGKKNLSDWGKD